jgi:hypothetical protein
MLVLREAEDKSSYDMLIVKDPEDCVGRFRGITDNTIDYIPGSDAAKIYLMIQRKLRNYLLPGSMNKYKHHETVKKTFIWHRLHKNEL